MININIQIEDLVKTDNTTYYILRKEIIGDEIDNGITVLSMYGNGNIIFTNDAYDFKRFESKEKAVSVLDVIKQLDNILGIVRYEYAVAIETIKRNPLDEYALTDQTEEGTEVDETEDPGLDEPQ